MGRARTGQKILTICQLSLSPKNNPSQWPEESWAANTRKSNPPMTLDELIALLKLANPETQVLNGFGELYALSVFPDENKIRFGPASKTTIGQMLDDAQSVFEYRPYAGDYPVAIEDHLVTGRTTRITLPIVLAWIGCDKPPSPALNLAEYPDLTDLKRLLREYADFAQGADDSRTAQQWVDAIYCEVINTCFGCDFWAVLEANRGMK